MKNILDVPFVNRSGRVLRLDLHLPDAPSAEPLPLVVWIVGGGWIDCPKSKWTQTWLVEHGFAVASV